MESFAPVVDTTTLINRLRDIGFVPTELRHAGDGWWSSCFAFENRARDGGERSLVVRVGPNGEYFAKDEIADRWCSPALPIPQVYALGPYDTEPDGGEWLCVSDRADGQPLEHVGADAFGRLVPDLVAAFGALRAVDPVGAGWGEWDGDGNGRHSTWRSFVDAAFGASHDPSFRSADWRDGLDPRLGEIVDAAERRLAGLRIDDAPRSLVHGDLLHGNVHVSNAMITGIFDWGAASWADPLLEPAGFEYWEPWHADLGIDQLLAALDHTDEPNAHDRWAACLILIGVSHIAFCGARIGETDMALEVADRLTALVEL